MSRLLARIKNLLRRKEEQVQQGLLDGGGFYLTRIPLQFM